MTKSSSAKIPVNYTGESSKELELMLAPKPNDNNKKRKKPPYINSHSAQRN